jgi:lipoprotein-releasing system permease protein
LARLVTAGSVAGLFQPQEGELRDVVIGSELATRTGLAVGDVAEIISANVRSPSAEPVRRFARVGGVFRSGLFEYDSTWIYLSLDLATMLTGQFGQPSVISVQVSDIFGAGQISQQIRNQLGQDYTTIDWQEANQPLFTALTLERRMGVLIIALIIFIAALNITTTLILVVVERRRDIAILNALGATGRSITMIFMIEGALVGGIGALLGVLLGVLSCAFANYFKLISLPADVYSISFVPLNIQLLDILWAASLALVLSLLATIYPARAAAQVKPAAMLRDAV